ncbi:MAG: hypothetical protein KAG18_04395 [Sinobacterium sp.]|nr:hypothetical protein [Sinobacterium sp.]
MPIHLIKILFLIVALSMLSSQVFSDESTPSKNSDNSQSNSIKSPWIITPLVSSNPKLGTSAGVLTAYMYKFDLKSPASLFGMTANYSDTKSWTAVAFAKAYLQEDKHRLAGAYVRGKIYNDYDDYNGLGPIETTDNLNFFMLRYSRKVYKNWYIGGQALSSNYQISNIEGNSGPIDNGQTGLTGYDSNALGLIVEFDNRDRQRSAHSGHYLLVKNAAYRKSFGGDFSFDTYDFKYTSFYSHHSNHVLVVNLRARLTENAPPSSYSSVFTKAYTRGQYLAPHTTSLEVDERIAFSSTWGMSVYGAVACLYGKTDNRNLSCSDSGNIYPSIAMGAIYTLKPKEGIVIRAEVAKGKGENSGIYLSFGQPF